MWKEFKSFAIKGNVLDLAVAVVIGAAFGKIVSSLVADIIMPLVGLLSGGINLEKLTFTYLDVEVRYGIFLQSVVDFFIISFSIFMVVKVANRFKQKETVKVEVVETPAPDPEIALLTEIRDLLKESKQGEA
ncbi:MULTISPECIES: large conductance mechanosensitive channel protein MscL [unclassified Paenibacillus]|uniref:large conductance mechanosensitive channel protein MscL n=1 Tax=unclassified Paenibacillus TaxID=185978 RepID=UPI00240694FF|nr:MULTISPECIES: large conductance mechanosensitive channel protein MscL [unclassified Paenibacillus]MDF9840384.1 large conductance mechanosensitive channel [Paenibacillus sp. PastF-2]MDF9846966.1 large conductance mechanosensitive channel [Paenibacillus sp. PastM-2]MDF9853538.1 large conductance mechanosensitive channel [Paenibacillus sp. PastF-1]MDH6478976.1 large conductance mechanosensitive channel [Paenibacillus sp. PastH-2]MDH6506708.1 large conductance mechanosensitive channel [Paenibac